MTRTSAFTELSPETGPLTCKTVNSTIQILNRKQVELGDNGSDYAFPLYVPSLPFYHHFICASLVSCRSICLNTSTQHLVA